jgi:hypothetical protein
MVGQVSVCPHYKYGGVPRKQRRGRTGDGSVYWSASQERYIGEYTLGRDDRGVRIRKVIVGPRGDKSDDARLGVKDRLHRVKRPKRTTHGRPPSLASN